MSRLPVISATGGRGLVVPDSHTPPPREAPGGPRAVPPLESLRHLTASAAFSTEVRRKLTAALRSAEWERGGELVRSTESLPLPGPGRQRATPPSPHDGGHEPGGGWRASVAGLTDGSAPQARHLAEEMLPGARQVRGSNFDVAELPSRGRPGGSGTASRAPDSSRRPAPALQDPADAFEQMNRALTYTMRYVDEATELDFDITAVREQDGSEMEDKDRLFLSVCCSVFANFALCTTLGLDLRKLAHFLCDLFKYYSSVNPYHNAIHAADALQMASLFFRDPAVNFLFSDEEILVCFLAVLAVDVAHPGMRTVSLAETNHPLVMVYGDVTTKEQSSLLVFIHQLFLDDNFFLDFHSPGLLFVRSRSLLREMLYDVALPAAQRARPLLAGELARISAARTVRLADVNRLLTALLVLSRNAFAFRSQQLAATWSAWWRMEAEREDEERQQQFLPRLGPAPGSPAAVREWSVTYCDAAVGAVADAVRALVPTDLFDNLERNRDPASVRLGGPCAVLGGSGSTSRGSSGSSHNNSGSDCSGSGSTASARLSSPPTPPPYAESASAEMGKGFSAWTDTTSDIMDILKKATAHATSLDRKASRGAILNASPPRSSTGLAKEWRQTAPLTGGSGRRSSSSGSFVFGSTVCSAGTPEAEEADRPHPSRAEHYFSFLRLYDQFELDGRQGADFAGQLIFLALQLDPNYVATAAREKFGDGCDAATCIEVAAFIAATEEAPTTAEAIATAHLPLSMLIAADEEKGTDSFLLYLIQMYSRREGAAAAALADECASNDSTATSPPPLDPRRRLRNNSGNNIVGEISPNMGQRDSPIRMPVGTDTSGSFHSSMFPHPLVER